MKKIFALLAATMMLSASAGNVTVFDGTAVSSEIPVSSRFMDWSVYTHQVIYPAAELTALQGQSVTAIKYYVANAEGCTLNGGNVSLYIGTTDQAMFVADYSGYTSFIEGGLTKVAAMAMTTGVNEIEFVLTEPWAYNGGNILIQTVIDADGSVYGSNGTDFLGKEVEGAAAAGKSMIRAYDFGPKTSFVFDGGDTPEPQVLRGDVDEDGKVNIDDVTALIDCLLSGAQASAGADCDLNNIVNIDDVTSLIDFLLSGVWKD
ncbi:MAG: hypothetical protein IJV05_03930 [Muribaculaceae bacterium]|nr:hypothetical protein [Muribaculaceae bacterium]